MAQMITPKEAYEWLQNGDAILIDVREPEEFQSEHIAYATSVPLSLFEATVANMNIPQNRKVIFQCLKGGRGAQACAIFDAQHNVENPSYNIDGGIGAWKESGLPVIGQKIKKASMSIFRQVQLIVGSLVAVMVFLGFAGLTLGFVIAGFLGAALAIAGLTGWCGLAMLLQKMPWNK